MFLKEFYNTIWFLIPFLSFTSMFVLCFFRTITGSMRDSEPSAADPNTHRGFVGEEITD